MFTALLCLGCLLTSCSDGGSHGGELFWGLFIDGKYQGNLKQHTLTGANFVSSGDGSYFLHLSSPENTIFLSI